MKKVSIVGVGLSANDLTAAQLEVIRSADILIGGRRLLHQFEQLAVEKHAITGKVAETIDLIKKRRTNQHVVVLASGDPLFFGIGTSITAALGSDQVTVYPNITTVAAAFARIGEPWSDAQVVSLHGRNRKFQLLQALKSHRSIAVLTDSKQSPQWLSRWLVERGVEGVRMAVFEQLGTADETFGWYTLEQAAERTFSAPNVAILQGSTADDNTGNLFLGMDEEAYLHERGLITKPEVRTVSLAKLRLQEGMTLWDLGGGSGSVGIEASLLLGAGRVVAVEKVAARVNHIRQNANRYGVYNHEVVQAELPDGLETLPPPDRIFIGGGGRHLVSIARAAAGYLRPGGIMVMNTVLMDNLPRALDLLKAEGMAPEVVQLQVSRGKKMPWSSRLEAENPVWIVSGSVPNATSDNE